MLFHHSKNSSISTTLFTYIGVYAICFFTIKFIFYRTFNCSYPSGSSKIRIRGGTATELTSAGVEIKYNYVELTKKGAFSLEQSTKPGRVFFIGAQSFLGLGGAEFYNAVCR